MSDQAPKPVSAIHLAEVQRDEEIHLTVRLTGGMADRNPTHYVRFRVVVPPQDVDESPLVQVSVYEPTVDGTISAEEPPVAVGDELYTLLGSCILRNGRQTPTVELPGEHVTPCRPTFGNAPLAVKQLFSDQIAVEQFLVRPSYADSDEQS